MSQPVILRIVRPYDTVDAFIDAEAWTVDGRGALLLEQPSLEPGTLVRFDISLRSGERLVRAEGNVVKFVPGSALRPPGSRVRFTRFGASTKDFIDRLVERRRQTPLPSAPPAPEAPEAPATRAASSGSSSELQGTLRGRSVHKIAAPENRDELLDRLRQRGQRLRAG